MIFEYVRDKRNNKVGVVVAISSCHIGWSACNIKKHDHFDKDMGFKIAKGRAEYNIFPAPRKIQPTFFKMVDRAKRYFRPDYVSS